MLDDFYFSQIEETYPLLDAIKDYSSENKKQVYIIKNPLADTKYQYNYSNGLVILIPKHKIMFVNMGEDKDAFSEYVEDFIEDMGSISDKYDFKHIIGRPKLWKKKLINSYQQGVDVSNIHHFINENILVDEEDKRNSELLISLLTGSINDSKRFTTEVANNLLDKVKQNIILFDGKQTRFIYQKNDSKRIVIQGLSGTGKTELLLHKLKDLYTAATNTKIVFTCYSKVLSNSLMKRIPEFFNSLRVEAQIEWNNRLWCIGSWGSSYNRNSGTYRYICDFYDIDFHTYGVLKLDDVCKIALKEIINKGLIDEKGHAFDYILIDESQDFPESFFKLCEAVTAHEVYIAGDIFQSIFDRDIKSSIETDFLLSKCYRTDPKTLMFAHGLGMALFEKKRLRWLNDDDWKACGYIYTKSEGTYALTREPLRRFDDLGEVDSIEIIEYENTIQRLSKKVIEVMGKIKEENPTVLPGDIAIMFPNTNKQLYTVSDVLEKDIMDHFEWKVNKSYETKQKIPDQVFLSNRNNVKGLEFPFVICITTELLHDFSFRNALYMMLTRSFIKSYLLTLREKNLDVIDDIENALKEIKSDSKMTLKEPTVHEKKELEDLIIKYHEEMGQTEILHKIFDDLMVPTEYREKLITTLKEQFPDEINKSKLKKAIELQYNLLTLMES